jgi:hypothetical protein
MVLTANHTKLNKLQRKVDNKISTKILIEIRHFA